MLKELAEVFRYRELLLNLIIRDIKVRYKNSILGFFWSLSNPLLQVATITIIFKYVLKSGPPNYSAYLLCVFLPWTFFQMSVLDSSMSVLMHGGMVKKIYFPREILPISIVLSNLVHFIMALVVFFIYLFVLGVAPRVTWLWLPVLVFIQLMLNLGVALFVSCLNVFYEDIKYMATVVMNLMYFGLPIMYFVEQAQSSGHLSKGAAALLYYVNPLPLLLIAYRKIMLPPYNTNLIHDIALNYWYLGLAAVTSLCIFVAGYAFFNSRKWYFAERL